MYNYTNRSFRHRHDPNPEYRPSPLKAAPARIFAMKSEACDITALF
jgi:hypothetical protein